MKKSTIVGSLMLIAGIGILGVLGTALVEDAVYKQSAMAHYQATRQVISGPAEQEAKREARTYGLIIAGIGTTIILLVGYFVRDVFPPFWYIILSGAIPGFLIAIGWYKLVGPRA